MSYPNLTLGLSLGSASPTTEATNRLEETPLPWMSTLHNTMVAHPIPTSSIYQPPLPSISPWGHVSNHPLSRHFGGETSQRLFPNLLRREEEQRTQRFSSFPQLSLQQASPAFGPISSQETTTTNQLQVLLQQNQFLTAELANCWMQMQALEGC